MMADCTCIYKITKDSLHLPSSIVVKLQFTETSFICRFGFYSSVDPVPVCTGRSRGNGKFTFQRERLQLPCCASITWHKVPFSYYEPREAREGVGVLITGHACPRQTARCIVCPSCDYLNLQRNALFKQRIRI